ncbi:hypothetical protein HMPREF0044_0697 [Gleimia coleocanis DSM 15436]|uniref:DUF559 domain-containing protein n=1 Tax=Gleimia coleocanis DSM 15436 TaxID=525245 RepID=C0W0V4_9ACTO|nr:hypothetical protein [Gleimia coleocanis]EEH63678.1 hypothetical protein HMPREF0044_0697 [Gleimia coleocanis DSM 15436]
MKYQWITLNRQNEQKSFSESSYLKRLQVTKTLTLEFPREATPWEIHQAALATLTRLNIERSQKALFVSGSVAAGLYNVSTWKLQNTIRLITISSTAKKCGHFGVYKGFGSFATPFPTKVQRIYRQFPPQAFTEIAGFPTLHIEFLILDFLCQSDPLEAFTVADALARLRISGNRFNRKSLTGRFSDFKSDLVALAKEYLPQKHLKRVLGRIQLLDPFAESAAESVTRVTLLQLGVSTIKSQFPASFSGQTFFADFYLPDLNIILEVDGNGKYSKAEDITREKAREAFFLSIRV